MKKFLLVFVVLFALLVFAGCEKLDSLEWEVLPKSVFVVGEEYDLDSKVQIKINGKLYTLADAKDTFKDELTITGFNLNKKGLGTLIIKYKTLSLYWAYQVIEETTDLPEEVDEYEPSYGWFEEGQGTGEYVLKTPGDLYGFANIVNGRYDDYEGAYDFAGKTVKLDADIDLTGKVWVPIGEGVRKQVEEVKPGDKDFEVFLTKITRFSGVASEEDLIARLNSHKQDKKDLDDCVYLGNSYFAQKVEGEWKYFYSERSGVTGHFFAGTFDGQGHTIKGLSDIGYTPTSTIYANNEKVLRGYSFGLFGIVKGNVTIKNLNFENVQIVGTYYDAEKQMPSLATMDSVGAAIGYVAEGDGNLLVENVKVLSGFISGEDAIAGIVGRAYNYGNMTFKNLENRAQIISNGHAGGMVGYIKRKAGKIEFINNANYGNIISSSEKGTNKAAGAIINFVGGANSAYVTFDGCRNFGNIVGMKSKEESSLGLWSGAAGASYTIEDNCYNYGVLTLKA